MTPKCNAIATALPCSRGLALVILAWCSATSMWAQAAPAAVDASTLAKYDRNNNGVLDENERAEMAAEQRRAATPPAATSATPSAGGDEVVQMSPFEVTTGNDRGYYAANTMSGTRLNTRLEDLGSSISVVTKQQMQDLALLDINDIFLYEANTEGTGNYTDFTVDRNGNVVDNVAGNPNNANRIRGITSANQSRGNFATSGSVPIDPINIDSVELSRGPNSNIFGLGNASGTVNVVPARANLTRESTTLEFRTDDRGSYRGSIDLNRPLLKNKLAVRASAVRQKDEYKLEPSGARSERYNGMITYKPFRKTTIRGAVEYYEAFARRPNSILPRDAVTYWEQIGMPTWNPTNWTVTRNGVSTVVPYNNNAGTETTALGPGLESGGSGLYARPGLFIEPNGTIPLWMIGRQSGIANGIPTPDSGTGNVRFIQSAPEPRPGALWPSYLSLANKDYYDWTSINMAAPNWSRSRTRTFTGELEQFILDSELQILALQLGWFREESKSYNRTFIGQGTNAPMIVYVDVNTHLLDGRVNPFFGRPYINAQEPSATRNPFERTQFRGQLAYQLKLSGKRDWRRWIGDHSATVYGEYKNTVRRSLQYRDAITSDHAWLLAGTNRGNGTTAARGNYRYYLGDANGHDIDYNPPAWESGAGSYELNWYNASLQRWVAEPATIGEVYANIGNTTNRRNLIKTQGAAMQNHLFNGRIVTTFGRRKDVNLNRDSAGTPVQPDGKTADLVANRTWPNDWFRREGETETAGVVVKPFRKWRPIDAAAERGGLVGYVADIARSLNLHYNESDSFLPETVAQNLMGVLLPDPRGNGKDYGFSINVWDNRLVLRFNQYETTQTNSRAGESGIIAQRAARIDFSNTTGGSDRFNLYRNAREWVASTTPGLTEEQLEAAVAQEMGFPLGQLARMNAYTKSDTSDVTSKGKEIEISYNPGPNWRSRITVGQMRTVDNNLSPAIGEYIESRWQKWQTIVDKRDGRLWWTKSYGGTTPEQFFIGSVQAPYKLAIANEGKPKSQVREWRVNAFSTLQLAAITDHRFWKRFAVNGAVRWEDKGAIGYFGDPNDINAYDPNRPIYDESHTYIDAGIQYNQKVWRNKVNMRLQLNVRNLTESGRLQPIGALPDGRMYNYRIIDPRTFIFTASFSL